MRAMVLRSVGRPLEAADLPVPATSGDQVLIRVQACAVCRTDLHIVDGELPNPKPPLILGHQIVGTVEETHAGNFRKGDQVGVPWLGGTCGICKFCVGGRENLCLRAVFTGYHVDGGFSEFAVARADYCVPMNLSMEPVVAAPLLCGGAIGFRAFNFTLGSKNLGLYGFGSAAHILTQVARAEGLRVYAFTRPGDRAAQQLARECGAGWAGGSDENPPEKLDAAIIFAPVGALVVNALEAVDRGGIVVCAGIHMSDIPSFPYSLLWEERIVRSVANLTRDDAKQFFSLIQQKPIKPKIEVFPLGEANRAMQALRSGQISGSAVLAVS